VNDQIALYRQARTLLQAIDRSSQEALVDADRRFPRGLVVLSPLLAKYERGERRLDVVEFLEVAYALA